MHDKEYQCLAAAALTRSPSLDVGRDFVNGLLKNWNSSNTAIVTDRVATGAPKIEIDEYQFLRLASGIRIASDASDVAARIKLRGTNRSTFCLYDRESHLEFE